jgi:hypothetical protein
MSARAPRIGYVLLIAAWAIAVAIASGADFERAGSRQVDPSLTASSSASGNGSASTNPVQISDSREGVAILTASNMKPGSSTTGTVTITNSSTVDEDVSLAKSNLSDTGPAASKLSSILDLRIEDVTAPSSPSTVYSGKLGSMPALALGTYAKRTGRSYRFTVTYPASAGSAYQGTSTSVDYVWTATKSNGGPKK